MTIKTIVYCLDCQEHFADNIWGCLRHMFSKKCWRETVRKVTRRRARA